MSAARERWLDKITVEHVYPPIPVRIYDYRATLKDYEPGDAMGYGRTADDAIDDLIDQLED